MEIPSVAVFCFYLMSDFFHLSSLMNFDTPIRLEQERVRLRPMVPADFEDLLAIACDPEIWRFTPSRVYSAEDLNQYMEAAFVAKSRGQRYPFTIVEKTTGRVAGSTSLANYSAKDQRIEIGYTWLGREFQGTGLNRICKSLLLTYACEDLQCLRVELKTDVLNQQSRRAMQKLGCKEEGILRSHTAMHDGRRRDTIFYSILREEWPAIRAHLTSLA